MAVHTIRLRAPWKGQRRDDCDLWERSFGRPTNLLHETVRLVVQSESARGQASLNDRVLGPVPGAYEVTELLKPRNLLVLAVASSDLLQDLSEPPFEVRLEIST
ncbi:MAG: hypothetical protein ACYC6Y_01515 [Thermoguttaceae bacterium]